MGCVCGGNGGNNRIIATVVYRGKVVGCVCNFGYTGNNALRSVGVSGEGQNNLFICYDTAYGQANALTACVVNTAVVKACPSQAYGLLLDGKASAVCSHCIVFIAVVEIGQRNYGCGIGAVSNCVYGRSQDAVVSFVRNYVFALDCVGGKVKLHSIRRRNTAYGNGDTLFFTIVGVGTRSPSNGQSFGSNRPNVRDCFGKNVVFVANRLNSSGIGTNLVCGVDNLFRRIGYVGDIDNVACYSVGNICGYGVIICQTGIFKGCIRPLDVCRCDRSGTYGPRRTNLLNATFKGEVVKIAFYDINFGGISANVNCGVDDILSRFRSVGNSYVSICVCSGRAVYGITGDDCGYNLIGAVVDNILATQGCVVVIEDVGNDLFFNFPIFADYGRQLIVAITTAVVYRADCYGITTNVCCGVTCFCIRDISLVGIKHACVTVDGSRGRINASCQTAVNGGIVGPSKLVVAQTCCQGVGCPSNGCLTLSNGIGLCNVCCQGIVCACAKFTVGTNRFNACGVSHRAHGQYILIGIGVQTVGGGLGVLGKVEGA